MQLSVNAAQSGTVIRLHRLADPCERFKPTDLGFAAVKISKVYIALAELEIVNVKLAQ